MADDPWIRWFTANFLTEVADLEADEIGVYAVIINLMADRAGPIENDAKWLARRCGTSTRRFNQIRAKLLRIPGLLIERDGLLGHVKMLREIQRRDGKSAQARSAAMTRWQHTGEPELPLGNGQAPPRARTHGAAQEAPIKPGKKGETSPEQNDLISRKNGQKPQKTANSTDADASPPVRAREEEEEESRITTHPESQTLTCASGEAAPTHLNDADLMQLFTAVCEAAGFAPIYPNAVHWAMKQIEEWRDAGMDFERTVIPAIRQKVAESSERTRSLGRFKVAVAAEHAHRKSGAKPDPVMPATLANPVAPDDPDPRLRTIRDHLRRQCGTRPYDGWLRPMCFGVDGTTMTVEAPTQFMADWVTDHFSTHLRSLAKTEGFARIRIFATPP